MCTIDDFKHLKLDSEHSRILRNELAMWHKIYLPCGDYPIDIGAGNGETAQFYLNHGAKAVLSIEPDSDILRENFGNDPRITIWDFPVTFIKSDCEGGEKNATFEIHFPYRVRILKRSFPYHGAIVRIEEDWGRPARRFLRLICAKLLPLIW